jgi:hypothetical protein
MSRIGRHLKMNAVAYLALFVALGGTGAYAASSIVSADGTINGCYKFKGKGKGQLRVVKAKKRCKRGERKIAWQQEGEQGVAGARGPAGARGVAGTQGPAGPRGATGTVDTSNFYDKTQSEARYVNDANNSVDSDNVVDIPRSVPIPLTSFTRCVGGSEGLLDFADTLGAPELISNAGSPAVFLRFRHTGGSDDSVAGICSSLTIPPDYVSGGRLRVRATRANTNPDDRFTCFFRRDAGVALESAFPTSLSSPGAATYQCFPPNNAAALPQANAGYGVSLEMEGLTTDLDVHSVDFIYTARQ